MDNLLNSVLGMDTIGQIDNALYETIPISNESDNMPDGVDVDTYTTPKSYGDRLSLPAYSKSEQNLAGGAGTIKYDCTGMGFEYADDGRTCVAKMDPNVQYTQYLTKAGKSCFSLMSRWKPIMASKKVKNLLPICIISTSWWIIIFM